VELLLYARTATEFSYEKNDIIVVKPDGFEWGIGELNTSVFTIVTVPDNTDNLEYANYVDSGFVNKVGVSGVGVFRHMSFGREKLKMIRRRKYTFNTATQKIEGKV